MSMDSITPRVITPGATIGILGSGQLGRMMAIAAKQMGYRVHIFSPSHDSPAGQVANLEIQASYTDLDAVNSFARHVDVVTLETENIPLTTFDAAARCAPAFPGREALRICQNRKLEKQFLLKHGIPSCRFKSVRSLDQLREVCNGLLPAVLKTTTGGYDGKGQAVIKTTDDVEEAWQVLQTSEAVLEEWIEYDFEFSIVGFRNSAGKMDAYPSIRNRHRNGILEISVSPSGLPDRVNREATELTYQIMQNFESVGVLAVEFFYRNGDILVNEIAPRPHNSGHLTVDGHLTCQFEQHVRAICGLPAGSTRQFSPAAMANLLGRQWHDGQPNWKAALAQSATKLHLYGKTIPEAERKMGHLTSLSHTSEQAVEDVLRARRLLMPTPNQLPQAAVTCPSQS